MTHTPTNIYTHISTNLPSDSRLVSSKVDAKITLLGVWQDAKNKVVEHVLILSGDHLYRMDYMDFIQVISLYSCIGACAIFHLRIICYVDGCNDRLPLVKLLSYPTSTAV